MGQVRAAMVVTALAVGLLLWAAALAAAAVWTVRWPAPAHAAVVAVAGLQLVGCAVALQLLVDGAVQLATRSRR